MSIRLFRVGASKDLAFTTGRTHAVLARVGDVVITKCGERRSHYTEQSRGGGTVYPGDLDSEVTCKRCLEIE